MRTYENTSFVFGLSVGNRLVILKISATLEECVFNHGTVHTEARFLLKECFLDIQKATSNYLLQNIQTGMF